MTRPLDERFADWVDGRLSPAERAALEAEMARDPELRRVADEYRQGVQLVRSALAPGDMGTSLADTIMASLRAAPAPPSRTWRPYFASLVAAAALFLVFLIVRLIPPAGAPTQQDVAAGPMRAPASSAELAKKSERGSDVRFDDLVGVARAPMEESKELEGPEESSRDRPTVVTDPVAEGATPANPQASAAKAFESVREQLQGMIERELKAADPRVEAHRDLDSVEPTAGVRARAFRAAQTEERDRSAFAGAVDGKDGARQADANEEPSAAALGALALVVEVPAPTDVAVWREIDARVWGAESNVAEVLALLAPPLESAPATEGTVDYRRLKVARLAVPSVDAIGTIQPGEPEVSGEGARVRHRGAGTSEPSDGAKNRATERSEPQPNDSTLGRSLAAGELAFMPSDRVFSVVGSRAELTALMATLRARMPSPMRFAPPKLTLDSDEGRMMLGADRVPPSRSAASGPAGAPAGPGSDDARLELLLVLRRGSDSRR